MMKISTLEGRSLLILNFQFVFPDAYLQSILLGTAVLRSIACLAALILSLPCVFAALVAALCKNVRGKSTNLPHAILLLGHLVLTQPDMTPLTEPVYKHIIKVSDVM
jgi:hypothetical protein